MILSEYVLCVDRLDKVDDVGNLVGVLRGGVELADSPTCVNLFRNFEYLLQSIDHIVRLMMSLMSVGSLLTRTVSSPP